MCVNTGRLEPGLHQFTLHAVLSAGVCCIPTTAATLTPRYRDYFSICRCLLHLQVSAAFPGSAETDTLQTLSPTAPAGKQLEQSRTDIPAPPKQSNAVAAADTSGYADATQSQAEGSISEPAGKALQQTMTDVPLNTEDSNAAAADASGRAEAAPSQAEGSISEPAGKALQQTMTDVPLSTGESNAAAAAAASGPAQVQEQSRSSEATGKQLQQAAADPPVSTGESNAAATASTALADAPMTVEAASKEEPAGMENRSPRSNPKSHPNGTHSTDVPEVAAASAAQDQQEASTVGKQTVSGQSAGQELQQAVNAIPTKPEMSNAAAEGGSAAPETLPGTASTAEQSDGTAAGNDVSSAHPTGRELKQSMNATPPKPEEPNVAVRGDSAPTQGVSGMAATSGQTEKRKKNRRKTSAAGRGISEALDRTVELPERRLPRKREGGGGFGQAARPVAKKAAGDGKPANNGKPAGKKLQQTKTDDLLSTGESSAAESSLD